MSTRCVDYLNCVLDLGKRKKVIRGCQLAVEQIGVKNFGAIAFRGMSGAVIAPALSDIYEKPLIIVRKKEASHSGYAVEFGCVEAAKQGYIIIDDLISSGATTRAIIYSISDEAIKLGCEMECKAIILYNDVRTVFTPDCHKPLETIPVHAFYP